MRFSTKSRYGLRLMAELACSTSGRAMPLKEISERQQLSLKYLEQLVTRWSGRPGQERTGQPGRLPPDQRPPATPPPVKFSPPWRGAWPPFPVSRARSTSAPCPASAPPCPSGPGWTMSSTSISTASLWPTSPKAWRRPPAAPAPAEKTRPPAKKHLDICRIIEYNSEAFDECRVYRGIAQLVEQRSPKPRAVSSRLTTPAKSTVPAGTVLFCLVRVFPAQTFPCGISIARRRTRYLRVWFCCSACGNPPAFSSPQ